MLEGKRYYDGTAARRIRLSWLCGRKLEETLKTVLWTAAAMSSDRGLPLLPFPRMFGAAPTVAEVGHHVAEQQVLSDLKARAQHSEWHAPDNRHLFRPFSYFWLQDN